MMKIFEHGAQIVAQKERPQKSFHVFESSLLFPRELIATIDKGRIEIID